MVRTRGHYARVTQESTIQGLDCPPAKGMLPPCGGVAIKLFVALAPANRPSVIVHHVGVGVHGGERLPITLLPTAKPQTRGVDYHSDTIQRSTVGESTPKSRIAQKIGPPKSSCCS